MKYIMSSKRIVCNKTSTYFISGQLEPVKENDGKYVGSLVSNFSGSIWNLYDRR